jgi:hypothetical protein
MSAHVTVTEWIEMFRTIGLSEQQMHQWHEEFERLHPEGHQGFLEWLALPADRIAAIREASGSRRRG